jgi:N-acetylmuramoyl-L-alanine amidase
MLLCSTFAFRRVFPLLLALPLLSLQVSGATISIIRPDPREALGASSGKTFVVGQVKPRPVKLLCNGEECDLAEDGAFLGYVPIDRVSDEKQWQKIGTRICDARFIFEAVYEEDRVVRSEGWTWTPLSPSYSVPARQILDPPVKIEVLNECWIALEGDQLGNLLFIPKGASLNAAASSSSHYFFMGPGGQELSILKADVSREPMEPSQESPSIHPVHITIPDQFTLHGGERFGSSDTPLWGFQLESRQGELKFKPRTSLRGDGSPILKEFPLRGMRICLDPGHHPDPGARGPRGFEERTSNLILARELKKVLEEEGAEVFLTREENPLPLRKRHDRMRELRPDLVLSLHNNSVGDNKDPRVVHGAETYFLHPWSEPFAKHIHQAMVAEMNYPDKGCIKRNLYITRFADCPSILLEPEYLILPDQEKKFMNPAYQQRLAVAIKNGILSCLLSISK